MTTVLLPRPPSAQQHGPVVAADEVVEQRREGPIEPWPWPLATLVRPRSLQPKAIEASPSNKRGERDGIANPERPFGHYPMSTR
jgi:hypothetical protein